MGKVKHCCEKDCTRPVLARSRCSACYRRYMRAISPERAQKHRDAVKKCRLKDHEKYKARRKNAYWKKHRPKNLVRMRNYNSTEYGQFASMRRSAKVRGLSASLTRGEFADLRKNPCFYCNGILPKTGAGLDRLDNAKGYELGNVVPCCRYCNELRGNRLTPLETYVAVQILLFLKTYDSNNE